MESWFVYMIAGVVVLVLAAIVMAFLEWKLTKRFPQTMKAKVLRIEKLPDDKYKYHFDGRSNGRRIMEDEAVYKTKKFKVGEKITVRMGINGDTCHSNFPLWPMVISILCIIVAFLLVFSYYADKRNEEMKKEAEGSIYQEPGYYIVTNDALFLYGDNLGLTKVEDSSNYISTGDYGSVIFLGTPKYDEGSIIPKITSLGSNVSADGTAEYLPEGVVETVLDLGYTINYDITDSAEIIEANGGTEEENHDHNGDGVPDHDVHEDEYLDDQVEVVDETFADETHESTNAANDGDATIE